MKTTMKWIPVVLVALAVMVGMHTMGWLIGATVAPMLGEGVAWILLVCYAFGASALYTYSVIVGLVWLAESGWFE